MSKGNWLKLHRELQSHWVSEKLEWLAGWVDILMSADWEEGGTVCLTLVPAREKFSASAWHHFINRLIDDGMLSDVETVRLGKGKGSRQTARVTNWDAYQSRAEADLANSKRESKQTLNEGLTESYNPVQYEQNGQSENSNWNSMRESKQTLNVGHIKNTTKEDKELKDFKTIGVSEQGNYEIQKPERREESTEILVFTQEPLRDSTLAKKTSELQNEDFSAARDEFYELWNVGKPATAHGSNDNAEVNKKIKEHVGRLGAEEFLERTRLALVFMRNDKYLSTEYRAHAITLLRHLDTYADKGRNHHGMSDANAKLTAFAMRAKRAAESVEQRRRAAQA